MTTSLYKLRNEYGLSSKGVTFLSRMLTRGECEYQLSLISLDVKPINGKDYVKNTKARVFDLNDMIEAVITPTPRKYTVSVHQARLDQKLREDIFSELSKIQKGLDNVK